MLIEGGKGGGGGIGLLILEVKRLIISYSSSVISSFLQD
jgi:hypothetical protein